MSSSSVSSPATQSAWSFCSETPDWNRHYQQNFICQTEVRSGRCVSPELSRLTFHLSKEVIPWSPTESQLRFLIEPAGKPVVSDCSRRQRRMYVHVQLVPTPSMPPDKICCFYRSHFTSDQLHVVSTRPSMHSDIKFLLKSSKRRLHDLPRNVPRIRVVW